MLLALLTASVLFIAACSNERTAPQSHPNIVAIASEEGDAALNRVAADALGEQEGTAIVMDITTGRIRAVANPAVAFEQSYPPGSAIKPFTALTALRSGLIHQESRWSCGGRYTQGSFTIACSHPKSESAFDLSRALAHSCNYWFATVGSRLGQGIFNSTLASFGFGTHTGINVPHESAGRLPRGDWRVENALGDGGELLVTPVQLINAYAALVNGGRLFRPRIGPLGGFRGEERKRIAISDRHIAMLLEGMRDSVTYGTSATADLASLPIHIFGKTGTSTSSNGFRTQGWFVGFAAPERQEPARIAVLVFLKRSHGSEAARVARPIFEEVYKQRSSVSVAEGNVSSVETATAAGSPLIRVHLITQDLTVRIPIEEYIRGVLAAESGTDNELEALKAQAIVSRTFALKNLGRHSADGYDFCSSTHCQRYRPPVNQSQNAQRAIADTQEQMIVNGQGEPLEVFFHAACGGMTANLETLWGIKAPTHLRGIRDDYCSTMPHRNWIDTIPAAQLVRALKKSPATDVGSRLDEIIVTKRDPTGRAETIALEGERRREVHGWEFKMTVSRSLGWNLLKSSRFEVSRYGAAFVFRGGGFGHGLGLCQEGAHVMAVRGVTYEKILDHYFPGAQLAAVPSKPVKESAPAAAVQPGHYALDLIGSRKIQRAKWLPGPAMGRVRTLSSEHFRIRYPASLSHAGVAEVLAILEQAHGDVARRLISASVPVIERRVAEVTIHSTTQEFMAATGQPWWAAAATGKDEINLQPLALLKRKNILETTLRHEYTHLVVDRLSGGSARRWLAEGLAVYIGGEGRMLSPGAKRLDITMDELERRLVIPSSPGDMRALYLAAYLKVRSMIAANGESAVWRELAQEKAR